MKEVRQVPFPCAWIHVLCVFHERLHVERGSVLQVKVCPVHMSTSIHNRNYMFGEFFYAPYFLRWPFYRQVHCRNPSLVTIFSSLSENNTDLNWNVRWLVDTLSNGNHWTLFVLYFFSHYHHIWGWRSNKKISLLVSLF